MVWKYSALIAAACISFNFLFAQQDLNSLEQGGGSLPPLPAELERFYDTAKSRKAFIISKISVSGNRKTKDYVIKRELPFKEGDSIKLNELVDQFRLGRQQLVNTRLFNEVVVYLARFNGYLVDVQVDVKERWYIFPLPYFKPVDRNLQTWADKGYSFNRVNYGAKLNYYNVTGRNDHLKLWLITGYTRQVQAFYEQPNADKSLKLGYGINLLYNGYKEVNPLTLENNQIFVKSDSMPNSGKFLEDAFSGSFYLTYRPGLLFKHLFKFSYVYDRIDNGILAINPKYLSIDGKSQISYPELTYSLTYSNIDYVPYPLKGIYTEIALSRRGLNPDVGMWSLGLRGTRAWDLKWKSSFSIQLNGMLRLPFDQPFINHRLFGYNDFYLRGLEKYVVDGVAGAQLRNTVRRELFRFDIPLPIRSTTHDHIPFRIYAKTYSDMGYSINKLFKDNNTLTNKMLFTAGAGFDVVTFYDIIMRFEYSFNQLGQGGFYFHFRNDF